MIYDRPRDLNFRALPFVFGLPSFKRLKTKPKKQNTFTEKAPENAEASLGIPVMTENVHRTTDEEPLYVPDVFAPSADGGIEENGPDATITESEETAKIAENIKTDESAASAEAEEDTKHEKNDGSPAEEAEDQSETDVIDLSQSDADELVREIISSAFIAADRNVFVPSIPKTDIRHVKELVSKSFEDAELQNEERRKSDTAAKEKAAADEDKKETAASEAKLIKAVREKKKISPKAAVLILFAAALCSGSVISFIIPLRPSFSDSEKRELQKFPDFTVKKVLDGSYFDDITLWFSDTFPFRDHLTKLSTDLEACYSINRIAIHGELNNSDDIPDEPFTNAPKTEKTEESPAALTESVQTSDETAQAPETTAKPTEPEKTEAPEKKLPAKDKKVPDDYYVRSLGAIIVADNSGYEYYNFVDSYAKKFITNVNSIRTVVNGKADVYSLIVPTSIDITMNTNVRKEVNSSDQKKALNYFNSSLTETVAVPLFDAMNAHRDEYIYFRTDHHWTALGAYYAYEQFCLAKNISPVPLDAYETKMFKGFLGTFYTSSGQNSHLSKTPDTVKAYLPFNNNRMSIINAEGEATAANVITDVTKYAAGGKYLTFISGDQGFERIDNLDLKSGRNCLVIKDSYGNAFVPFLIPHYKSVFVADPRSCPFTLSEICSTYNIHDIIYISNISTTRNSVFIDAVESFVK